MKFVFFWEIFVWDYGFELGLDGFMLKEVGMLINLIDFVVGGIKTECNPANPGR